VLLLFDIDGTLLSGAAEAHRAALLEAVHTVHGVDAAQLEARVATPGRTDGEIARLILLHAGVSAARIDELADAVRDECCRAYARLSTADLSHTVLPGMRELLDRLSSRDDVTLSLVTGNFEPVARIKLWRAGIGGYFPAGQGGFGSDHEDRAALPPIARRRAGSNGVAYPRERTIVIGDTPRDVACAHADGLRCLAVTTGPCDPSELAGADAVVDGAAELGTAIDERLLSAGGR
jgi:phosphoglycolate phosphatase-like HAD superfamily hydrolase